ncbi:MAG: hypothetical protein ACLVHS_13025 [Blautia wexlerae]
MSDINKDDFSQIIKFKIDAESADNISQICDDLKTKSDIMRQLIPIVSCKEFEHMIPNIALEQLENYSKKLWEILHTLDVPLKLKSYPRICRHLLPHFRPEYMLIILLTKYRL